MRTSSSRTLAAAPTCLNVTITLISSMRRPGGAKAPIRSTRALVSLESPNSSIPLSGTSVTPLVPGLAVQVKKMTCLMTFWTTWRRRKVLKRLSLGPSKTTPSGLSRQLQAKAPAAFIACSQLSLKLSMMLGIGSTSMTLKILGAIRLTMHDPRKVGRHKALLKRERLSSGWVVGAHPRSQQHSSLGQRPSIENMTSRQMMRMTSHIRSSREVVSARGLTSAL
jgi:hypothetical protein